MVAEPLDAGRHVERGQPQQVGREHVVLEPRQRRLAGQGRPVRPAVVGHELEHRVVPQIVVVVAVGVPRDDAEHPLPQHRRQRLPAVGPGVGQARGHPLGVPPGRVELPDREQPRVGRDLARVPLDEHRRRRVETELHLIRSLRHHQRPPVSVELLFAKAVEPHGGRWRKPTAE